MENWVTHPEFMKIYFKNTNDGEGIPDSLVKKIHKARLFNLGFAKVEYLAATYLDLFWHGQEFLSPVEDATAFEKKAMDKIGLIDEIIPRYKSPYFAHVWDYGYDSAYYSYLWSEVIEADIFDSFLEKGIFNHENAKELEEKVLSQGSMDTEMNLFKNFRGREPQVDALLRRLGF